MGHIVRSVDEDINRVLTRFEHLIRTARDWTDKSCDALAEINVTLAREVIADNCNAEALRRSVVGTCDKVIIRRQPVAIDFRRIITSRDMASGITDICACARRIAMRVDELSSTETELPLPDFGFRLMTNRVKDQLASVVTAYLAGEMGRINFACELQKSIDQLDQSITISIERLMDSGRISCRAGIKLTACSHDLRIIAAQGARTAEHVLFLIGGRPREQDYVLPDEFIGEIRSLFKPKEPSWS